MALSANVENDLNMRVENGNTAWHLAAENDQRQVGRILAKLKLGNRIVIRQ